MSLQVVRCLAGDFTSFQAVQGVVVKVRKFKIELWLWSSNLSEVNQVGLQIQHASTQQLRLINAPVCHHADAAG